MRRTLFGQRSERTRHLLDQMELTFEECETAASEDELLAPSLISLDGNLRRTDLVPERSTSSEMTP